MPAVFGADMDVRCENGDDTTRRLSGFDLTRKVLSFGDFSLHQQRKVTRRKAKALLHRCREFGTKATNAVAITAPSRVSTLDKHASEVFGFPHQAISFANSRAAIGRPNQ
jgi:hypothetical protein